MKNLNIDFSNPNKVYSTGQTLNDFLQLSKLFHALDATTVGSHTSVDDLIPPVLLDPNYKPRNRAPALIIGHVIPLALALSCVSLRLYARIKRFGRNGLEIEDKLITVAALVMCALAGMAIYGAVHLQQGYRVTDLTAHSVSESLKFFYGTTFLYPLATCLIRVCIVLFFRRIYDRTASRMIIFCNIILVICCCLFISAEFAFAFECKPFRANWDIWSRGAAKCDIVTVTTANSLSTMILDFLILLIPISFISAVKGSFWKKAEVLSLFCMGITAWATNILGLWTFKFHYQQWDYTMNAELFYFNECVIGIICSCAPAIRTLFPSSGNSRQNTTLRETASRVVRTLTKRKKQSTPAKNWWDNRADLESGIEHEEFPDADSDGNENDSVVGLRTQPIWLDSEKSPTSSTPGSSSQDLTSEKGDPNEDSDYFGSKKNWPL